MVTSVLRTARLDVHRLQSRKQVLAGKDAVHILPKIGIKVRRLRVVVCQGDVAHASERREVLERFHPKLRVCLVDLWSDCQGLQGSF